MLNGENFAQRMTTDAIAKGTAHTLPADIRNTLAADASARAAWNSLTPLARNEWICWVTFVKLAETRKDHIRRLIEELKNGKRRPCCWLGCTHRTDKPVSPSVKAILARRKKRGLKNRRPSLA